ncbi:LOW QUALITY PROTEIN: tRNA-uridine aminocarboxypropyltransferase 2 [Geothlypis trichas]
MGMDRRHEPQLPEFNSCQLPRNTLYEDTAFTKKQKKKSNHQELLPTRSGALSAPGPAGLFAGLPRRRRYRALRAGAGGGTGLTRSQCPEGRGGPGFHVSRSGFPFPPVPVPVLRRQGQVGVSRFPLWVPRSRRDGARAPPAVPGQGHAAPRDPPRADSAPLPACPRCGARAARIGTAPVGGVPARPCARSYGVAGEGRPYRLPHVSGGPRALLPDVALWRSAASRSRHAGMEGTAAAGRIRIRIRHPAPATAPGGEGEGCEGLWEPVECCERRPVCGRCSRPQKVCLCPFLPVHPLKVSTCLYIIQHPAEESRVLRTVPLLAACLPPDKCKILVGRRFNEDRYPELATVCRNPNTLILYPGAEATNLEEVAVISSSPSVMIIIDGTWSQAKDIFYKNSLFRLPKQVQLKPSISSQYVIRTQPTNTCLSTLECAAVALSIMEKNKSIQETILHPLQALCSFQLQHGAQIHHSKEHLLKNGLYDKPMPKNKRKLRRMELLVNNVKI